MPYFKTGNYRWTDGGLQSDLPKQRLTELFNVNQFIVSQVNPLAPFFVPVQSGIPLLEQGFWLLKHQLVTPPRGSRIALRVITVVTVIVMMIIVVRVVMVITDERRGQDPASG